MAQKKPTAQPFREQEMARDKPGVHFPAGDYFQDVIDGLTDDVKIVDPDYRVVYVNQTAAARLFKSPEQILGQKCYEAFNHFDAPCPYCTTRETFLTGETLHNEFGYTDTRGDPYFFILTTFPIKNNAGKIPYVVELTRDITQERRLEQEVVKSRTLKAIGQFAAELAHEVRNPLNAISFQMALLKRIRGEVPEDPCVSEISGIVDVVEEEIKRLTRITRDFLTFTRQETLSLRACDLTALIQESLSFLDDDFRQKGIKVIFDPRGDPITGTLDPDRFKQVLLNLFTNAADAMDAGGTLGITLSATPDAVEILVSDSGRGIPRALAQKIFDPFFSTKTLGTGLGLSICKNIVEAHGGTLTLGTAEKRTTFKISLPVAS